MPDSDTQVAAPVRPTPPLVEGPSAWIGADMRNREAEWSYRLTSPEVAEIEAAVRQVRARRLDIAEIRRSAYEDWPEVERKRHLLRLWLAPAGARKLPVVFAECYGGLTVGDRGGIICPGTRLHAPLQPG